MRPRHQTDETGDEKVPMYIVTFSALVTLLLMFFVLLLTFAPRQDGVSFKLGQSSFRWSLVNFGLSDTSYGKRGWPDYGNIKLEYAVKESKDKEEFKERTIDASEERNRRLFMKLDESVKTIPSQIVGEKPNFAIADIRFSKGDAVLNESAKRFLTAFSSELQANYGSKYITVYVVGLASEGWSEKQQWILSAHRAQVVTEFLKQTLPPQTDWRIYCWGAGPGGNWRLADSRAQQQSHIIIGVLEPK